MIMAIPTRKDLIQKLQKVSIRLGSNDPFVILGIDETAFMASSKDTQQEMVSQKYKELKVIHPDRFPTNPAAKETAEKFFQAIGEAKDRLSDPDWLEQRQMASQIEDRERKAREILQTERMFKPFKLTKEKIDKILTEGIGTIAPLPNLFAKIVAQKLKTKYNTLVSLALHQAFVEYQANHQQHYEHFLTTHYETYKDDLSQRLELKKQQRVATIKELEKKYIPAIDRLRDISTFFKPLLSLAKPLDNWLNAKIEAKLKQLNTSINQLSQEQAIPSFTEWKATANFELPDLKTWVKNKGYENKQAFLNYNEQLEAKGEATTAEYKKYLAPIREKMVEITQANEVLLQNQRVYLQDFILDISLAEPKTAAQEAAPSQTYRTILALA